MISWKDLIRFIRCISRTNIDTGEKEYILRFSEKEVPWENLVMIAEMEGVTGFLHVHLKQLGLLDRLPDPTRIFLEDIYQQTRRRTLAYISEMKAFSKILEKRGLPVVVLQGLSLMPVYNDPGLRPFGDVDLMVRPSHKKLLADLFREMGYHNPMDTHPDIFMRNGICIDMHTHILNLERVRTRRYVFPPDLAPMWDKAVPLFEESDGLLSLDPYDNLIALSAHALKHGYSRLIWLVDLHESLLRLESDKDCHEKIVERARLWRQERILLYALILVEGTLGIKIPARLKHGVVIANLSRLERYILSRRIRGYVPREIFVLLFIRNIQGIANKIAFIKETVFLRDEILIQTVDEISHNNKSLMYIKRFLGALIRAGRIFTVS